MEELQAAHCWLSPSESQTVQVSERHNGALDGWLEMGILGTGTEIKNTMFTTVGPLCYIYI
jgi:hypothetical protein